MKVEIKLTGYRSVRFIGIDVLLPYIGKYTKKHFDIRLVSPKMYIWPNTLAWYIYIFFYSYLLNQNNASRIFLSAINF